MFTKIISALALMVICISAVTNINTSASSNGTTKDYFQNTQVFVKERNMNYTIQNANLTNPFKLAKQIGFAIATQNGGFTCNSERNKPKSQQICGELVLSTDIPRKDDETTIDYTEDCVWRWNTWSYNCYYSIYISDIGNY
jgi:hypothetical protein